MTLTISSRGQLVIPASIRKRYKLGPQSKVELVDVGGEIVLVPVSANSFRGARGLLRGSLSTKDLIARRRSERRKEHGT